MVDRGEGLVGLARGHQRVLQLIPEEAEYWDGPGKIMGAIKMAAAAVANTRPNYPEGCDVMTVSED